MKKIVYLSIAIIISSSIWGSCSSEEKLYDNSKDDKQEIQNKYDYYTNCIRESFFSTNNGMSRAEIINNNDSDKIGDILATVIFKYSDTEVEDFFKNAKYNSRTISYETLLDTIATITSDDVAMDYDDFIYNYVKDPQYTTTELTNLISNKPNNIQNLYIVTTAYLNEVVEPILECQAYYRHNPLCEIELVVDLLACGLGDAAVLYASAVTLDPFFEIEGDILDLWGFREATFKYRECIGLYRP